MSITGAETGKMGTAPNRLGLIALYVSFKSWRTGVRLVTFLSANGAAGSRHYQRPFYIPPACSTNIALLRGRQRRSTTHLRSCFFALFLGIKTVYTSGVSSVGGCVCTQCLGLYASGSPVHSVSAQGPCQSTNHCAAGVSLQRDASVQLVCRSSLTASAASLQSICHLVFWFSRLSTCGDGRLKLSGVRMIRGLITRVTCSVLRGQLSRGHAAGWLHLTVALSLVILLGQCNAWHCATGAATYACNQPSPSHPFHVHLRSLGLPGFGSRAYSQYLLLPCQLCLPLQTDLHLLREYFHSQT
jgi:hypothetical protein